MANYLANFHHFRLCNFRNFISFESSISKGFSESEKGALQLLDSSSGRNGQPALLSPFQIEEMQQKISSD
jgi:hypothetical protein